MGGHLELLGEPRQDCLGDKQVAAAAGELVHSASGRMLMILCAWPEAAAVPSLRGCALIVSLCAACCSATSAALPRSAVPRNRPSEPSEHAPDSELHSEQAASSRSQILPNTLCYCLQYRERIIFLSKPVDESLGNQLVATMLYLDSENHKDLNLYINTSGGGVSILLAYRGADIACMPLFGSVPAVPAPAGWAEPT